MNEDYYRIYLAGICTVAVVCISWYFYRSNKREQEQFAIAKQNSQYFMDRVKVQDMEQGL